MCGRCTGDAAATTADAAAAHSALPTSRDADTELGGAGIGSTRAFQQLFKPAEGRLPVRRTYAANRHRQRPARCARRAEPRGARLGQSTHSDPAAAHSSGGLAGSLALFVSACWDARDRARGPAARVRA